jgi:uncharacterized RDD family membrane protein YckC
MMTMRKRPKALRKDNPALRHGGGTPILEGRNMMTPTTPDPFDQPEFYSGIPTKRFMAWVVDALLVLIASVLIVPFTAFIGLFLFPMLMLIVGFTYRVATLASGSATWGMRLFGMELRTARDEPLDLASAFLHTAGYSVSVAMMPLQVISIILICSTSRHQSLTDVILGTVPLNRRAESVN